MSHPCTMPGSRRIRALFVAATVAAAGCSGSSAAPAAASDANAAATTSTATAAATCPNNLPTACPSSPPSYKSDIVPIMEAVCLECHAPGGIGATVGVPGGMRPPGTVGNANATADPNASANPNVATHPGWDPSTAHAWSDYNNIVHARVSMLQDVFLCRMPPANVDPLPEADRVTLMNWLVCGAPNN